MATQEEFEKLRKSLKARRELSNIKVQETADSLKMQRATRSSNVQTEEPTFFSRIGESFKNRKQKISDAFSRSKESQDPLSTGLQYAGQIAGGIVDVVGAGFVESLDLVTKDEDVAKLKKDGAKIGVQILQTPIGQAGMEALQGGMESYQEWAEKNPTAAANLEAVVNIAELLPAGRVLRAGRVGAGAKTVGETLKESGEAAVDKTRKSFIENNIIREFKKGEKLDVTGQQKEGVFGRKVVLTKRQKEIAEAVDSIEGVKPVSLITNHTHLKNRIAVEKAVKEEADDLLEKLKVEKTIIPKDEVTNKLEQSFGTLLEDKLTGESKEVATQLLTRFKKIWNEVDANGKPKYAGTPAGLLEARRAYDKMIRRESNIFDAKLDNARVEANRAIRDWANNTIDEYSPNVDALDSLKKQHLLLEAEDAFKMRAFTEGGNIGARAFNKIKPATIAGQIALTASLFVIGPRAFALTPEIAKTALAGYGTYKAGKFILGGKARKLYGDTLIKIEKAIPDAVGEDLTALQNAKTQLTKALKEGSIILPAGEFTDQDSRDDE